MSSKFLIIYLVILMPWMTLYGQKPEVGASLEKDTIMIGDQINLRMEIALPKNDDRLYVPETNTENFVPGLEVLNISGDTTELDERKVYRFDYTITGFDSGVYQIPALPVLAEDDTLFSNPLELYVVSPAVDTAQAIKTIKPPINTPFNLDELLLYKGYLAAGVVFLVLVFALVYFLSSKNKIDFKPAKQVPPYEKAMERLDYLKRQKIWQQGRIKEHYTILSDTIRIYIEERYGIRAMESLTSEIIGQFTKYSYDDDHLREDLEDLLNMSDMVKFAREDPTPAENETNLNKAYIFVEKTRPVEAGNNTKEVSKNV